MHAYEWVALQVESAQFPTASSSRRSRFANNSNRRRQREFEPFNNNVLSITLGTTEGADGTTVI